MSINHGANLFDLSNELGLNKKDIKDFSSNINPFGASKKAKDAILNNNGDEKINEIMSLFEKVSK